MASGIRTALPPVPSSARGKSAAEPGRRSLLRGLAASGLVLAPTLVHAADADPPAPPADPIWSRTLGPGVDDRPYGRPSHYEKGVIRRYVPWLTQSTQSDVSFTPLQDQPGIITANGLFYERYHSGRPAVDPARHRLLIHGLVERPLLLTMDQLQRFPSVARIHFLECAANGGPDWPAAQLNSLQFTHGMIGCAEWVGVPLATLFGEVGIKKEAKWVLVEGADGAHMDRSLPIEKCLDDCLVVWGQNGEALRPEQGFPLRLIVPGWQGNVSVKWLRRIEIGAAPWYTREETGKYTELLPDGKALGFTWVNEAKSVLTFPCPEKPLAGGPGFYELRGLAWSGRGRIRHVDVSCDGGVTYARTNLQGPVLSKALTRFTLPWRWDGKPTLLQSRATDETGYVQPGIAELRKVMGTGSVYLNNSIQTWQVTASGSVNNVQLS
ncbi:MAG TPA: sulfite dehydrogenase [Acetobacteraceae bacterium]|nr:sulfite dehydrogenase [Acetobacteraceae bacterium]